jgi:DNA adenine methylase
MTDNLLPIFKWSGGKRREIKQFNKMFPPFVLSGEGYTYLEPFVGGGAVYWYLNNIDGKNIINDYDGEIVNFYKEIALGDNNFTAPLKKIAKLGHDDLEKVYYLQRNKDRKNGLKELSTTERAIRFFVVNQLAFSGMRRFNTAGEFNVPFGHYKQLNVDLINSQSHISLLNKTEINQGDFEMVMKRNDHLNTFIFLDPPYTRVFKEYSADNSFGQEEHERLCKTIKNIKKASVMMIIDKSPFTEKLYSNLIKGSYQLKYNVNIKNRFKTAVEHLIVCNYSQKKIS